MTLFERRAAIAITVFVAKLLILLACTAAAFGIAWFCSSIIDYGHRKFISIASAFCFFAYEFCFTLLNPEYRRKQNHDGST